MPEVLDRVRIRAIGWRAAAALQAGGGRLIPIPGFPHAPYRYAGDQLVWLGHDAPMHPRAIMVDGALPDSWIAPAWPLPWRPSGAPLEPHRAQAFRALLAAHLEHLADHAPASALAPLLAGGMPAFPLAARHAECLALSAAARLGDGAGFVQAAMRLLGAGGGLTPSGDDFVGAALFTLRMLCPAQSFWADCADALSQAATSRTHAIAAPLFGDLAAAQSFACLHDLLDARDGAALATATRALCAIGHSSGWDMLAGVVAAATGLPTPRNNTNIQDTR